MGTEPSEWAKQESRKIISEFDPITDKPGMGKAIALALDAAQRAASVRVVELVCRYSQHHGPWHGIALKPGQSLAVIERPAAAAAGEGKKP